MYIGKRQVKGYLNTLRSCIYIQSCVNTLDPEGSLSDVDKIQATGLIALDTLLGHRLSQEKLAQLYPASSAPSTYVGQADPPGKPKIPNTCRVIACYAFWGRRLCEAVSGDQVWQQPREKRKENGVLRLPSSDEPCSTQYPPSTHPPDS